MTTYPTITGRVLRLDGLAASDHAFLAAVRRRYAEEPEWMEFAAWWMSEFGRAGRSMDSPLYRICQDLEARLGIAQGKVALPDYRDRLADLIEERFGSRSRFCEVAGLAPAHLGRVLASSAELSVENLQRILGALYLVRSIPTEDEYSRQPLWEPNQAEVPDDARSPFERIARLRAVLSEADLRSWLTSAHEELDGHSPIDLIRANRVDLVADLADDMLTGSPV